MQRQLAQQSQRQAWAQGQGGGKFVLLGSRHWGLLKLLGMARDRTHPCHPQHSLCSGPALRPCSGHPLPHHRLLPGIGKGPHHCLWEKTIWSLNSGDSGVGKHWEVGHPWVLSRWGHLSSSSLKEGPCVPNDQTVTGCRRGVAGGGHQELEQQGEVGLSPGPGPVGQLVSRLPGEEPVHGSLPGV